MLTTWYTERAVSFIERHKPTALSFCYVPHSMVHVPLFVSDKFRRQERQGPVRRRGHGDRLVGRSESSTH